MNILSLLFRPVPVHVLGRHVGDSAGFQVLGLKASSTHMADVPRPTSVQQLGRHVGDGAERVCEHKAGMEDAREACADAHTHGVMGCRFAVGFVVGVGPETLSH
jgi:hypothetical protein